MLPQANGRRRQETNVANSWGTSQPLWRQKPFAPKNPRRQSVCPKTLTIVTMAEDPTQHGWNNRIDGVRYTMLYIKLDAPQKWVLWKMIPEDGTYICSMFAVVDLYPTSYCHVLLMNPPGTCVYKYLCSFNIVRVAHEEPGCQMIRAHGYQKLVLWKSIFFDLCIHFQTLKPQKDTEGLSDWIKIYLFSIGYRKVEKHDLALWYSNKAKENPHMFFPLFLSGAFSSASLHERFNEFAYIPLEDTPDFPKLPKRCKFPDKVCDFQGLPGEWGWSLEKKLPQRNSSARPPTTKRKNRYVNHKILVG